MASRARENLEFVENNFNEADQEVHDINKEDLLNNFYEYCKYKIYIFVLSFVFALEIINILYILLDPDGRIRDVGDQQDWLMLKIFRKGLRLSSSLIASMHQSQNLL